MNDIKLQGLDAEGNEKEYLLNCLNFRVIVIMG